MIASSGFFCRSLHRLESSPRPAFPQRLGKRCSGSSGPTASTLDYPDHVPQPRRQLLTEYLPALRFDCPPDDPRHGFTTHPSGFFQLGFQCSIQTYAASHIIRPRCIIALRGRWYHRQGAHGDRRRTDAVRARRFRERCGSFLPLRVRLRGCFPDFMRPIRPSGVGRADQISSRFVALLNPCDGGSSLRP